MKRQISRREREREITAPFQEVSIDWSDLETAYDGYVRVMFITDTFSGRVFPYFMSTHGQEKENLKILKDFFNWVKERFKLNIYIVRSDNELARSRTIKWLHKRGCAIEPSAPRTQEQNGAAERSGGVIMERARAMRLAANLPHNLWKEIIDAAVYLFNRTPKEGLGWKTPFEIFFSHAKIRDTAGPVNKKPHIAHLRAYGCRAYAMTKDAQLKKRRRWKLDSRAHIGYLVGYDSTNIYRVWIPHKGTVISTRDVLFDEKTYFDGKIAHRIPVAELDDLVTKVTIPEPLAANQRILEDDEDELMGPSSNQNDPSDREQSPPSYETEESDDETGTFNQKEDLELAKALEEALLTPPPSEVEESVFNVSIPVQGNPQQADRAEEAGDARQAEEAACQGVTEADDRFTDFVSQKVTSPYMGAFTGAVLTAKHYTRLHKRTLPPLPESHRDLEKHPMREEFRKAQEDHLRSHQQMETFYEVDKRHAGGQQVLGCMWVFVYKTDKHGYLQKCKARLVVCGNQQAPGNLPTRATTLASTAFRALMGITAKFDLETLQMDAVNAFINCKLDEVVYMHQPPGFGDRGKVLRLRKALYGLRRSPLLWQQELTGTFKRLGFREVPQEPCVMINGGVVVFFYVDDIVFCYRKRDEARAKVFVDQLQQSYKMNMLGPLKWFLGIHILRNRATRTLWLSQEAYVDKLAHQYLHADDRLGKMPTTPMTTEELLPFDGQATNSSIHSYQRKTGSILFATITTRPDVAFAASRLARFNQNPSAEHHTAANRVIQYLYGTKGLALTFGKQQQGLQSLICASDASFADNSIDRKSSQGYVILLFGGPIAWRANKQDTVTTSTTEAELLALSQTAKESIFVSRMLAGMTLELDEPLVIQCDNNQTLRLVTEESAKLTTKLRHVDIHSHWLRQEYRERRVHVKWVPTAEMIADGLTKALPSQRHTHFVNLLGMEDIQTRLEQERRMEDLREQIKASRLKETEQEHTVYLIHQGRKGRLRRRWL